MKDNEVKVEIENFSKNGSIDRNIISNYWYNPIPDLIKGSIISEKEAFDFSVDYTLAKEMFCSEIREQESTKLTWIKIPEEVRNVYSLWRGTPLIRASRLEKLLKTPARIFYKYESGSLTGSYKLNTAIAQVYYNKISGTQRIVGDTGSGHWGLALAFACKMFDLPCTIYMVNSVHTQRPLWKPMIELLGAEVILSPSEKTESGRKFRSNLKSLNGNLGIAINEAIEDCLARIGTRYASGCLFNNVLFHQSVIGLEAKYQLMKIQNIIPDVIVGSCGGGSNLGGLSLPFLNDGILEKKIRVVAVESIDFPKLTKGKFMNDTIGAENERIKMKMFSLGNKFSGEVGFAGGLRYHGVSPIISALVSKGYIEAHAYNESEVISAAKLFARTEGVIPAIESAFAIKHVITEAERCIRENAKETILFNITGTGVWDVEIYNDNLKNNSLFN